MTEQDRAREARIRPDAARKHITEAVSGPEPDWVRCGACIDMVGDVMPSVREADDR